MQYEYDGHTIHKNGSVSVEFYAIGYSGKAKSITWTAEEVKGRTLLDLIAEGEE